MPESPASGAPSAWIIETTPDAARAANLRIWGLTPSERQRRLLGRARCQSAEAVRPGAALPTQTNGSVVMLRSDAVVDERLIEGLCATENTVLVAPRRGGSNWGGPIGAHVDACHAASAAMLLRGAAEGATTPPPNGLRMAEPGDLASAYTVKLRKFDPPYVYQAAPESVREIEDRVFDASYKGVTDLITKWLWPRPAAAVVRVLAAAGVRPNTVTLLSWVLTIAAAVLFWYGAFGLGLVCAWGMTFLDTVDGKLARVTLTSSRIGHVLDHGLDNVHPPFWYLAWAVGLAGSLASAMNATTAVVVIGYLVGRGLEAVFILTFGIETHCWRPIDSLFRTITARRNPNMILLTVATLGGRPDLGLLMVAIWTVVSIGFHTERVLQALAERASGVKICRWDEAPHDERAVDGADAPGGAVG